MALGESNAHATTGAITHASAFDGKGNGIASLNDSTYVNGWHILKITKNISWNNNTIIANLIYQYKLLDTLGNPQPKWKKGLIDQIIVNYTGTRDRAVGERLIVDDSASGSWTISGLANFKASPIFTGSYSRSGADTLITEDNNNMRTLDHSLTVSF